MIEVKLTLNGKVITEQVEADLLLIDFLRDHGCYSVKRGCETANCGLCTVLMDGTPILSCSMLTVRAPGTASRHWKACRRKPLILSGSLRSGGRSMRVLQSRFCDEHHRASAGKSRSHRRRDPRLLAGNLCRCTGYEGQLRGIRSYLDSRRQKGGSTDGE